MAKGKEIEMEEALASLSASIDGFVYGPYENKDMYVPLTPEAVPSELRAKFDLKEEVAIWGAYRNPSTKEISIEIGGKGKNGKWYSVEVPAKNLPVGLVREAAWSEGRNKDWNSTIKASKEGIEPPVILRGGGKIEIGKLEEAILDSMKVSDRSAPHVFAGGNVLVYRENEVCDTDSSNVYALSMEKDGDHLKVREWCLVNGFPDGLPENAVKTDENIYIVKREDLDKEVARLGWKDVIDLEYPSLRDYALQDDMTLNVTAKLTDPSVDVVPWDFEVPRPEEEVRGYVERELDNSFYKGFSKDEGGKALTDVFMCLWPGYAARMDKEAFFDFTDKVGTTLMTIRPGFEKGVLSFDELKGEYPIDMKKWTEPSIINGNEYNSLLVFPSNGKILGAQSFFRSEADGNVVYGRCIEDKTILYRKDGERMFPEFEDTIGEYESTYGNFIKVDYKIEGGKARSNVYDMDGKLILKDASVLNINLSGDMAVVRSDETGLCGVIDTKGKEIIPMEYDEIHAYSENAFTVGKGNFEERKWGVIDREGRMTLPVAFELTESKVRDSDDIFIYNKEVGKTFRVDGDGNVQEGYKGKYDMVKSMNNWSNSAEEDFYALWRDYAGHDVVLARKDNPEVMVDLGNSPEIGILLYDKSYKTREGYLLTGSVPDGGTGNVTVFMSKDGKLTKTGDVSLQNKVGDNVFTVSQRQSYAKDKKGTVGYSYRYGVVDGKGKTVIPVKYAKIGKVNGDDNVLAVREPSSENFKLLKTDGRPVPGIGDKEFKSVFQAEAALEIQKRKLQQKR